jgi:hypothetical protein
MKRSALEKKIFKQLKNWQDCKFEKRMAEEVLQVCLEAGMLAPPIEMPEEEIDESIYTVTQDGEVCTFEEE